MSEKTGTAAVATLGLYQRYERPRVVPRTVHAGLSVLDSVNAAAAAAFVCTGPSVTMLPSGAYQMYADAYEGTRLACRTHEPVALHFEVVSRFLIDASVHLAPSVTLTDEPMISDAELFAAMDEAQDRARAHLHERTHEHRNARRYARE